MSRRVRVTRTLCAHRPRARIGYAPRVRRTETGGRRQRKMRITCYRYTAAVATASSATTHCCTGVSRQWCTMIIIIIIVHGQRITLHYPPCRTSSGSRISSVWTTGSSVHTRVSARVIRHR